MKQKKREPEDFSFRPFKALGKIIESPKIDRASREKQPIVKADPSDEELFHAEMKGVREIKEFRRIEVRPPSIAPNVRQHDTEKDALKDLVEISRGRKPFKLENTQEYVEWVNPAYSASRAIAKNLHGGCFAVQDFLDLHGFTIDEAEAAVDEFLKRSLQKGLSCVKIIHGRGLRSQCGPVLKESLIGWLSGHYRKNIIAFSTARQCDGGLGATYVLLKQRPVKKKCG